MPIPHAIQPRRGVRGLFALPLGLATILAPALASVLFIPLFAWAAAAAAEAPQVSDDSQTCMDCHTIVHPGIVEGWKQSRHAATTPARAAKAMELERRISADDIPENLAEHPVGCAECHTLRPEAHADTFEHNGYQVHVVVSPDDCATCHPVERDEFNENIMAWAHVNLQDNPTFRQLVDSINGQTKFAGGKLSLTPAGPETEADSCLYCHGTKLGVDGTTTRDTTLGEMEFPVITGWPNGGVGRINLDGSKGSCTSCHTRHMFSIELSRKPATCEECHNGPDVPAYKVYMASKHGNIYAGMGKNWDFSSVPWVIGRDFEAPTCAACHMSLLTNTEGEVVAERTHAVSPRLPWRIFGLVYAAPQPKDPNTSAIMNAQGLHMPTNLDGSLVSDMLIGKDEMDTRRKAMQSACLSCHDPSWVDGHWARFEQVIKDTNAETGTATQIIEAIWDANLAPGLPQKAGIFDDYVEKVWSDVWLFYTNTVRFSSAMACGGDYGVFADGRYWVARSIRELNDWYSLHKRVQSLVSAQAQPAPAQPAPAAPAASGQASPAQPAPGAPLPDGQQ